MNKWRIGWDAFMGIVFIALGVIYLKQGAAWSATFFFAGAVICFATSWMASRRTDV